MQPKDLQIFFCVILQSNFFKMKQRLPFLLALIFSSLFFAQPAGYYNGTAGLSGAALKSQLRTIITNGHQDQGYGALWTGYATTDRDHFYENDNSILDIYSENPAGTDPYTYNYGSSQCGTYNSEADCYNREHIIPQSFFNESAPMVSDIHHIRPTDGYVNNMRGTYAFGKVGTASFTSMNGSKVGNSISPGFGGTVFEPIDAFKGDVARMIFYFVTRYENQLSSFSSGNILGNTAYPGLQNWQLQQLIVWHVADPVSAEEIARNNASQTFQGNRNPYIDNPQWVHDVWGSPDTTPPTAPTNLAASAPTSNSITLNWTAATDNVGVAAYDIYVNGVYHSTVTGTSSVVSGLNSSTVYSFYVIAKVAAGNVSAPSNTATEATLAGPVTGTCASENFENIPTSSTSYGTNTWTNTSTNISWTATDSRTDQLINGRAIMVRNGTLTSSTLSGGVQNLTVTTMLKFSGSPGTFSVRVNGVVVGTAPYSATQQTTTISNINVSGNAVISFTDNSNSTNRVAFDDLSWDCFTMTTAEHYIPNNQVFYPNPVTNGELHILDQEASKIKYLEILTPEGRLVKKILQPFAKENKVQLGNLIPGIYLIRTDKASQKIIVK